MGGVFLSYAAQDEKAASLIVTALAASGVPISPAHPQPQPALKDEGAVWLLHDHGRPTVVVTGLPNDEAAMFWFEQGLTPSAYSP